MPTLELSVEQVIELVRQLPPEGKLRVLRALDVEQNSRWGELLTRGEQQLRRLCSERGLDWDSMGEEEREAFANELVHEDR